MIFGMKITKETQKLAISKGCTCYSQRIINSYNVNGVEQESDDHGLTQNYLQTWLRNEKNLHVDIYLGSKTFKWEINNWIIDLKHQKKIKWTLPTRVYNYYEDALEICLQEMLKLCQN